MTLSPVSEKEAVRLNSLMYHEIVTTPTGSRYAVTLDEFKRHLSAIQERAPDETGSGFAITFDDGHPGWLDAGEALAQLGWKAIFFVVTRAIGRPGELSTADLRLLAGMGHLIGSHTVDHPPSLSDRDYEFIKLQWTRSKAFLEDALGAPVLTAAVPGGYYSDEVGRAADEAGLRYLFTSEPVTSSWNAGHCVVLGRYTIFNGTSARLAAALAAGDSWATASQFAAWNVKKTIRKTMPGLYFAVRDRVYPKPVRAAAPVLSTDKVAFD